MLSYLTLVVKGLILRLKMARKVYKCLICGSPTVADNKLCKNRECHAQRLKERMHIIPEKAPESGVYTSLTLCTHGKPLTGDCEQCEVEWQEAQQFPSELPSNPRIKIK